MFNYEGISLDAKDLPGQVEYNRRKNLEQDNKLALLNTSVNSLLAQSPAGFLPRVYYGNTLGNNTYRFTEGAVITLNEALPGVIGDSYEITSSNQTTDYIAALAIQTSTNAVTIQIKGDYPLTSENFTLVNMRTGDTVDFEGEYLTSQEASYLGNVSASNNKNKQITVVNDIELGATNIILASLDLNNDNIWNWVKIGSYVNGTDGESMYSVTNATIATVLSVAQPGDSLVAGEAFTYNNISFAIGDVKTILTVSPLTVSNKGNIRGPQGVQGVQGNPGTNGTNGYTPYIQDGYWYINGVNTNVKAIGTDGTDGQDGQAFNIQQGLYSVPENWGESGNVDPDGNPLLQLPTIPATGVQGKGYVVYDPLTTPLDPYYDLYWADDNDSTWTIMHPFSGLHGENGSDGYTPYIQNGNWYINGVDTGVSATGPQGPVGPASTDFAYLTEAPTADNNNGYLKVVLLSSEPATKYNGYIYFILET